MLVSLIFMVFLFSGCQSGLNVFDKTGTQYEKGLQYTKVKSLIYKNENKAIINVTYLNSVDNVKWDNEKQNFLVGIYISKDHEDKNKQFINNTDYTITMNNMDYANIVQVDKNEKQYSHIPLKNPWAKYYLISFDNDDKKNVKLNYSYNDINTKDLNTTSNMVTLQFEKE